MTLRSYGILLFILFAINPVIKSQTREFIVGSVVGLYGIHIQGDISEMYSPTNGNISGTGGLSFGLNVKHNLSQNMYGAFELRYIRKGSIYEFSTTYGTHAFESIRLDYIEIPLLVGIKIHLNKKYLLTETGIVYARMIFSKMSVSALNFWDCSTKLNDLRQNDISWVATIKYPVIKSGKLLIGFRFEYSLISIHSIYKLYNMDYGVEMYYLFNRNLK